METIKDIIAEMRDFANGQEKNNYYDLREMGTDSFRAYADRIEAAHKHELERGAEAAQLCGEIGEAIGRESVTDCNQLQTVTFSRELMKGSLEFIKTMCEGYDNDEMPAKSALYRIYCNVFLTLREIERNKNEQK